MTIIYQISMTTRKVIKYALSHCDIIAKSIEDIIPSSLLTKYEFDESRHPDYVFYSVTDRPEIYSSYPNAIKIFISGEPVSPAFTFFDYCIGMDRITFGDRYCYYPDFIRTCLANGILVQKNLEDLDLMVAQKNSFMDYIQSHDRPDGLREKWVKLFQTYKHVDCPGPHLHNVDVDVSSYAKKIAFQTKHKFSLIVEASDHPNFITEKIIHAFIAGSIPVYYGTKDVGSTINQRAFLSLNGKTETEAIDTIKWLDNDDQAYRAMLCEPIFNNPSFIDECVRNYELFLDNIFSQKKDDAFRREHWNYEERIRKSLKKATLILPTKDRLSAVKRIIFKK